MDQITLHNRSTSKASKERRDLINKEIDELRELLPLTKSTKGHLSYIQVMSAVCAYIRRGNYFNKNVQYVCCEVHADLEDAYVTSFIERLYLPAGPGFFLTRLSCIVSYQDASFGETSFGFNEALPGFIIMVSSDCKLLFVSENIADYLGHSMVELLSKGALLGDLVDEEDLHLIWNQLHLQQPITYSGFHDVIKDNERRFVCRMLRSQCFKRRPECINDQSEQRTTAVSGCSGRTHDVTYSERLYPCLHHSHASKENCMHDAIGCIGMKPVLVRGMVHPLSNDTSQTVLLALCNPLQDPSVRNSLDSDDGDILCFTSMHDINLRIKAASDSVKFFLGFTEGQLINCSWYQFVHHEDLQEATSLHCRVRSGCGQCTSILRMLTRDGRAINVRTIAELLQQDDVSTYPPAIQLHHRVMSDEEADYFRACRQQ